MKLKDKIKDTQQLVANTVRTCSYDSNSTITNEMIEQFLSIDVDDALAVGIMNNPVHFVETKHNEYDAITCESHRSELTFDAFKKEFTRVVTTRFRLGYGKLWIYCPMFAKSGQYWCRIGWSRK